MSLLEIWPGSRLVLENLSGGEPVLGATANPYILYFLLAVALLALVLYGRIADALAGSFKLMAGGVNLNEVINSKYRNDSVRIGYILMVPFYAFVFYHTRVSELNYWWILVALVSFFVFKFLLLRVLGWATNNKETFISVEKHNNAAFFMIMVLSFPALVPVIFTSEFPVTTMALYMLAVAILLLFIYFIRINKIFISSGLSVFFSFLYLCALEILPILVVVKVVVLTNGN